MAKDKEDIMISVQEYEEVNHAQPSGPVLAQRTL